jgi:hypothetical protein
MRCYVELYIDTELEQHIYKYGRKYYRFSYIHDIEEILDRARFLAHDPVVFCPSPPEKTFRYIGKFLVEIPDAKQK